MADSVLSGDQATTLAFVIFTSILFLMINLGVDVLYGYLDRRVVLKRA
jgi:ABC-type dipeptide/oligopeptide/nickel transport system permease component